MVMISLQEAGDHDSLQQVLSAQAISNMITRQTKVINDVLLSDEELCTNLEGIECYVLQNKVRSLKQQSPFSGYVSH